jgi:glycosyltransferase involved in cell wall biosynthesis
MLGQLPKAQMPIVWTATDASLIVLRRADNFTKVLPSKMFEAMGMARPTILGVEGEARALLEEAGAGIAVTPESAEEIAAAIVKLANTPGLAHDMGERGRAFAEAHFDRDELAQDYLTILAGVAGVTLAEDAPPAFAKRRA